MEILQKICEDFDISIFSKDDKKLLNLQENVSKITR